MLATFEGTARSFLAGVTRDLLDRGTVPGGILYGFLFAFAAWLLGRALRVAVQRALANDKHQHFDQMAVKFLAKLARYGVYLFAFVAYARFVPFFSGFGAASLASISVMSVIVGFAAQNTLGNLIAGLSLLLYRPFKLGDRLQVTAPSGLETGIVESLTLGYTLLKTDDNRRVVVPNSLMASQTVINLTANDPRVICSVLFGISHASDIDRTRSLLLELGAKHAKVTAVCGCPLTQLSGSGVVLSLDMWCGDAATAITLRCDLLEQAARRLADAGVSMASPRTTVALVDDRGMTSGPRS